MTPLLFENSEWIMKDNLKLPPCRRPPRAKNCFSFTPKNLKNYENENKSWCDTLTCADMHANAPTHTHLHVFIHTHSHTQPHTLTHTHAHSPKLTNTHPHSHTLTHAHRYSHTHICSLSQALTLDHIP